MEKLVEVRFQKPSSQGRERLRVELFKDRLARSTMRVKTATKVEYARHGRKKKKREEKAKTLVRVSKTDRRNTDVYRHPGDPPLTEGFDLARHLGEEPWPSWSSSWISLISVFALLRVIGAPAASPAVSEPVLCLSCGGAVVFRLLARDSPPTTSHRGVPGDWRKPASNNTVLLLLLL